MVSAMLFNSLQHSLVLHWIARDFAVKVRREFDGTLTGVIDRGEAVDE